MVIVNGVVHPVDAPAIPRGFVAWEGERITAVGPMEDLPERTAGAVIDAAGGHVVPGLVDAHTHLGLFPDGGPYDEDRLNAGRPVAPEFAPLDSLAEGDRCFAEALAAGVTTVVTGPGSKNPIGGQMVCLKTDGRVVKAPIALKLALGETPERAWGLEAAGLMELVRESFSAAQDGPLAAARAGELAVHVHVHRASDIAGALALKEELGLRMVLVHGTGGRELAGALAAAGVGVITGPAMTDRSRAELKELCMETPALLAGAGVKVAVCTDHPETPAKFLPLCAALAVQGGMSREEALRAVTLTPAELLGLEDRLGSLTPGKEADMAVFPGGPFDPTARPRAVILGGRSVL